MSDERLGTAGDAKLPPEVPGESRYVEANGRCLHAVEAGPTDGKLVVLLHGFPEFWYCWHEIIGPLADAGYRVLAPDQRGYNRSEKPDGVMAYHVDELADDLVGLLDAAGRERATVVGHDWGAGVGWWTALRSPDRVAELVAVNGPHPTVFLDGLRRSWRQRLRCWHVAAFQVPALPERLSALGNWWPVVRGMAATSRSDAFTGPEFDRYRSAWSRPRAFRSMMNWYRAAARKVPDPGTKRVTVPTLVAWGTDDRFLPRSMARESVDRCEAGRLLTVDGATHWITHEEPNRLAEAIGVHAADG